MVRPRRCRWVRCEPQVNYFKPQGVKLTGLERVELNIEELEAIRLKDHKQLDQKSAALQMKISQPTFHRIYTQAKAKIAKALVEGLAIKIHGGVYKMPGGDRTGPMGQGPMTGRGMGPCGRGLGFGRGARGFGRGAGFGRGMGWRSAGFTNLTKEEEKRLLEEEKADIERRLKELEE